METFGGRLKKYRQAANKTQEEVAAEIGISRAGYMLLETDVNGKTFSKLPAIAKSVGCTIDALFPEMDPEPAEKTASAGGFEETRPAEVKENEWAGMTF